MFFGFGVVFIGVWVGFWGVWKMVFVEDGNVDFGVVKFVKWVICVVGGVMFF